MQDISLLDQKLNVSFQSFEGEKEKLCNVKYVPWGSRNWVMACGVEETYFQIFRLSFYGGE
jgi:hypothetical protein